MNILNSLRINFNRTASALFKMLWRILVTIAVIWTILFSQPDMSTAGGECSTTTGHCITYPSPTVS